MIKVKTHDQKGGRKFKFKIEGSVILDEEDCGMDATKTLADLGTDLEDYDDLSAWLDEWQLNEFFQITVTEL